MSSSAVNSRKAYHTANMIIQAYSESCRVYLYKVPTHTCTSIQTFNEIRWQDCTVVNSVHSEESSNSHNICRVHTACLPFLRRKHSDEIQGA